MTAALWLHVLFLAPRVLLQSPPGLEQYVPLPGFNLCASHGIPVEAGTGCVQLSQARQP